MAFDRYGMPTDNYAQAPSQTGTRAPKPTGTMFDSNTGINGGFTGGQAVLDARAENQTQQQPFDRNAYMTGWGGGTPEQLAQYNSQYGIQTKNDVSFLPTGEAIDMIIDSGGQNGRGWTGVGSWSGGQNGQAPQITPYSGGGGGGFGAFSGYQNSPYTPGQLPQTALKTYAPGQLNQKPTQDLTNNVLQQVLSAPALSPEVQAQMQGQLKDQALTMQQGQGQDIRQSFANRGIGGGGQERALMQALQQQTQSGLLNNYRDLGVTAAQSNRQDQMNALGAAENAMNGEAQRFGANENLRMQGVNSENAATQFALQRALEEEGMKQAAAGLGLQSRGQDLQNSQFGQNLGFNYAQLNSNNNNTQMMAILRALGL